MLGKAILPWFGGVVSVWIVATLFFQGMLVFGYGYAYLIARFLKPRVQSGFHVALLFGSLALLPVDPSRVWHAGSAGDPPSQILRILFLSIGLPYFLLSATGPLIQSWYARAERVAFPYRLFALSNLGSLTALLAYPVVVEPIFALRRQMVVWSVLYGSFVVLCSAAAFRFWRARPLADDIVGGKTPLRQIAPGRNDYLLWGALAAASSGLLITVMNHLCQNVAPIPLLWVLPLATYLLTFILCFDRKGWYIPGLIRWLLPPALGALMLGVYEPEWLPHSLMQVVVVYLVCLFVVCLFCHGELASRKPDASFLTSYYLTIALGGAVTPIAIGLVAPRISNWQVEFPETIAASGILGLWILYPKGWTRRTLIAGLSAALILMAAGLIRVHKPGLLRQARSFYGVLSVTEGNDLLEDHRYSLRTLYHGTIMHGSQLRGPDLETIPTSYYGPASGVGLLLSTRQSPWNVAVVGLGAGTLAAYSQPLDSFHYYEIDPLVVDMARSQFTYLKLSRAPVSIAIGDGRLLLEKTQPKQFDLLVVDAFSGDAIPTHLLTQEAFEMYFSKLKPDGVIAVHISNLFIDLAPVLSKMSATLHKQPVLVTNQLNETSAAEPASWVLIAGNPAAFRNLPFGRVKPLPQPPPGFEIWTDDYSNVLQLMK